MKASQIQENKWILPVFWAVYLLVIYIIVGRFTNPKLIYHAQETPFFTERSFFLAHWGYPGGPMDYLGALALQFFFFGWPGTAVLTGLFAAVCGMTYLLVRRWSGSSSWALLAGIPAPVLLLIFSNARFPLAPVWSLAFTLGFIWIYSGLAHRRPAVRITAFAVLGYTDYMLCGGFFLFFLGMAVLQECTDRKQVWPLFIYLAAGFIFIWSAYRLIFIISAGQAAFMHLPFTDRPKGWTLLLLILLYPLFYILSKTVLKKTSPGPKLSVCLMAVIAAACFIAPAVTRNSNQVVRITHLAREKSWKSLLDYSGKMQLTGPILAIETNRALYFRGQLGDSLFFYPQHDGIRGLFVMDSTRMQCPMEKSDLLLDLGLLNESIHWASETVSSRGETPYALRQLGLLYALKKEYRTAGIYLTRLERAIPYRGWAREMKERIASGGLDKDTRIQRIRANLFDKDYIAEAAHPAGDLENLIQKNPENRMACEYLAASTLLDRNLPRFIRLIPQIRSFYPTLLPAHYEEAVLFYMYGLRGKSLDVSGIQIRKNTIDRYKEFVSILEKSGNEAAARAGIPGTLRGSYWFYYLYGGPVK